MRSSSTSLIADGTVAINDARTVGRSSQYLLGSLPEVPTRSPIATTGVFVSERASRVLC